MTNQQTWGAWFHGLAGAAITGLSNGIALVLANEAFDIFKDTKGLLTAALTATLVSTASYLKASPLPFYRFEGGTEPLPPGAK